MQAPYWLLTEFLGPLSETATLSCVLDQVTSDPSDIFTLLSVSLTVYVHYAHVATLYMKPCTNPSNRAVMDLRCVTVWFRCCGSVWPTYTFTSYRGSGREVTYDPTYYNTRHCVHI